MHWQSPASLSREHSTLSACVKFLFVLATSCHRLWEGIVQYRHEGEVGLDGEVQGVLG